MLEDTNGVMAVEVGVYRLHDTLGKESVIVMFTLSLFAPKRKIAMNDILVTGQRERRPRKPSTPDVRMSFCSEYVYKGDGEKVGEEAFSSMVGGPLDSAGSAGIDRRHRLGDAYGRV